MGAVVSATPAAGNDNAECVSDSSDGAASNLKAFSLPSSRFTPEEVHLELELSGTKALMAECCYFPLSVLLFHCRIVSIVCVSYN